MSQVKTYLDRDEPTHILNIQYKYHTDDIAFMNQRLCAYMNQYRGYQMQGYSQKIKLWWDIKVSDTNPIFETKNIYSDHLVKQYVTRMMADLKKFHHCEVDWTVTKII